MSAPQHTLTASQTSTVRTAREAMRTSHFMSLGTSGTDTLCRNIGRLEIALEAMLRLVDELTDPEDQS